MALKYISLWTLLLLSFSSCAQETRFEDMADKALSYCLAHNMDTGICFLVDMSISSGKNRLVVWDFEKSEVLSTGLCTHGSCNSKGFEYTLEPQFSNVPESHCSSLGKYRIGKRSWSSWGINIHYKLHGLEDTNNKVYDRIVVFHSWGLVPNREVHPQSAPESWGCPAVSNELMRKADLLLQEKGLPVLMWIFK